MFAGQVLKLVTKFLPPWYTDSEVERVDWMNKTLDKVWMFPWFAFRLWFSVLLLLFVFVFCLRGRSSMSQDRGLLLIIAFGIGLIQEARNSSSYQKQENNDDNQKQTTIPRLDYEGCCVLCKRVPLSPRP